ncbi:hypothetical protein MSNKSG1_15067 [Marinobacter santoriniensis NKSG1]|uniref:DUF2868 domain-containing protein n=1 Tax=Marinobacter santoriniensis NKSG1 TaxID=1288826 RepID=M7CLX6_9GAMM|nr:DUF2868 domain-containing protein [Marinobacter santoriniensis]EMP54641.1 hypothetical protein MSNKSG1_15067 [Marinobacter santoriniensis NKSG1]
MSDSPLRLLLDFDDRFQRDRDQSAAFLHRRDRRFALDCEQQGKTPDVARWLTFMDRLSGPGGRSDTSRRDLKRWRSVNTGFAIAGSVLGILTMTGLLFYDGGQRINITVILGFVALQLLLALATTLQPLFGGQPWAWLLRRLGRPPTTSALTRLQPFLMARAAHIGGAGFAATGLLTLLAMIVVQDLAFGWSTTLDTAAPSYHSLIRQVATPWAWLWPSAVPSMDLVEATRFFRASAEVGGTDPQQWGQWWPFVVMLWVTWVLFPRVVLLALSQGLLRRRARRLLAGHPGMQALLYRMETPALDTGSAHNDADDLPDIRTRSAPDRLPDTNLLICWAGTGDSPLPAALEDPGTRIFKAGGRATLAEDEEVIHEVARALEQTREPAVVLVSRSWEPPTGELQDFLLEAREHWPRNTRIALLPLAPNPLQRPADGPLQTWLRFAERLPGGQASVVLPALEAPEIHPTGSTLP